MRLVCSVLFAALLASCAVIPNEWYEDSKGFRDIELSSTTYQLLPPPPPNLWTSSEVFYQNNFVLNENMTAKVGEIVLRVKAFRQDNYLNQYFRLDKEVTATVKQAKIKMPPGKYTIVGRFEHDGETFYVMPPLQHHYFLVNASGELQPMFLYGIRDSEKVSVFSDKARFSPASVKMHRVKSFERPQLPFLDFEVIYEGIKDNQIVLFYKDAIPGTEGGAGSFDTLFYPVDSTMISVEGRLLRILQATKEQLVYVVVKE